MLQKITVKFIISLIKIYKILISPLLPNACRFYPTCSDYAIKALSKLGLFKGCVYTVYRLLRCNPFCAGGIDDIN